LDHRRCRSRLDAINVGIGSDEKAFTAGIDYGEVLASIYWPDWIRQGNKVKAALEGPTLFLKPWSVHKLFAPFGAFNRVVIAI